MSALGIIFAILAIGYGATGDRTHNTEATGWAGVLMFAAIACGIAGVYR